MTVPLASESFAVYRAILRSPDLSDDELAAELEISMESIRVQVGLLERLGFVSIGTSGDTPSPTPPDMALARYAAVVLQRASSDVSELGHLAELLGDLNSDFQAGWLRTSDALQFEVVAGAANATNKLFELIDQCRMDYGYLINASTVDGRRRYPHATHEPEFDLIRRGGRVRHIAPTWVRDSVDWSADLLSDMSRGLEVRMASGAVPPMFAIFDNDVALVPIDHTRTGTGAVVVRSQSLAASLRWLFEEYWRQCTPLVVGSGQDARRREVLRLLSVGAKDEAIARALGVGLRTIRREISDLMDQVGAGSRFQLGLLAGKQGLID